MDKKYQVVGIGNALVDVLAPCDDAFLTDNGVEKGIMQLIDTGRAAELYDLMGPAQEVSGGSAANTIAGIAVLGDRTAYVGKVKADKLGDVFERDIRAQGADFEVPRSPTCSADGTGRCMVLVTPDSERSMNTYLGVSEHLGPDDIDPVMMADAEWLYLEGYRFDGDLSHAAFAKAIASCKDAGGKVSVTLSDPFCVERHHQAFSDMIRDHVDLLFCNEHEMAAMYPAATLEKSIAEAASHLEIVACTLGANGAYVVHGGETVLAPAEARSVVDVTGAGDLVAAGFLHGLVNGYDMMICGRMGCVAAGEIISHIGARPEADLGALFVEKGLQ